MKKVIQSYQDGITLVSLIVTIVVLLILAGVTIKISLGSDGLVNKTTQSIELFEQDTVNEEVQTEVAAALMNVLSDGGDIADYSDSIVKISNGKYTYTNDNKEVIFECDNNGKITIISIDDK